MEHIYCRLSCYRGYFDMGIASRALHKFLVLGTSVNIVIAKTKSTVVVQLVSHSEQSNSQSQI